MVRRTTAEPRAIWAGGMPQVSLARLKTWINTSNVERAPSRPFGGWDVEAIVEAGGWCETNAWDGGCQEEPDVNGRLSIPRLCSESHFAPGDLFRNRFDILTLVLTLQAYLYETLDSRTTIPAPSSLQRERAPSVSLDLVCSRRSSASSNPWPFRPLRKVPRPLPVNRFYRIHSGKPRRRHTRHGSPTHTN